MENPKQKENCKVQDKSCSIGEDKIVSSSQICIYLNRYYTEQSTLNSMSQLKLFKSTSQLVPTTMKGSPRIGNKKRQRNNLDHFLYRDNTTYNEHLYQLNVDVLSSFMNGRDKIIIR